MMKRFITVLSILILGTGLVFSSAAGAAPNSGEGKHTSNQSTIPYYVNESRLPFDELPGYESDRYWGVHKGAGYRIEVPKDWNGELVLYAHGFRGTGLELYVENPERLREHLLKNGYAWAASSYSTNGYDVAQGVKDTHALGSVFRGIVGNPKKTYVTGHSMGGHITAVLAEQYGNTYAGALPMCGVTGDTELFDFFTDYGLVAQALSGIEKEDQQPVADARYFTETVPEIEGTLGINGDGLPETLTGDGQKLKTITMNLSGGQRPLFDVAFQAYKNFLLGMMPTDQTYVVAAGNVIDTTDSVYDFDGDNHNLSMVEKDFNEMVKRIKADPQTKQQGLTGVPKVNGDHTIPMISLHDIGDLFVPFHMQQIHAQRAKDNGNADLLVTRAIRAVGHCDFTVAEEREAFDALVDWVENGNKPEGDDVLNPVVVSDEHFGTKFTREYRRFDPEKYHKH